MSAANPETPTSTVSREASTQSSSATTSQGYVLPEGRIMPNTIFVGGIDVRMDETEIRSFFARYGSVKEVKIITDRTGVSKGYGFVSFYNDVDVQKIVEAYPPYPSSPVQVITGYQLPVYNYQVPPQWPAGEQRSYVIPPAYTTVNYHCNDVDPGAEVLSSECSVHEATPSSGNGPQKANI
ncbi:Deleted in azoospermia-like [Camelus dromedarius]|uniref:Deleted in azoospermia-like n=1 Tax=Camelus dromedarius TaxID=9838 RepID=A0A5N4EIA1_CAMDR|nr:Deleted in azoospermia-like [Camelus dromedarius]